MENLESIRLPKQQDTVSCLRWPRQDYPEANIMSVQLTGVIHEMKRVDSLELAGIGYRNGNLVIDFHHGRTYEYFGVPMAKYDELMQSNDRAELFHNTIDGHFGCKRIT
jgi:hypothetical protein